MEQKVEGSVTERRADHKTCDILTRVLSQMAGRKKPTMKSAASTAPTPSTSADGRERQIDRSPAVPGTIQSEVITPQVIAVSELQMEAPEKKGAGVKRDGDGSKLKASLFRDDSDDDLFDSPAASIRKSGGGGAKSIFE